MQVLKRITLSFIFIILSQSSHVLADQNPPIISQEEKVTITSERESEKDKDGKEVYKFKTKITKEKEIKVKKLESVSPDEEILQEEEDLYEEIEIDEYETVVVSAQRVPIPKRRVAENIKIYTKEDIAKIPARDLSEVLNYIPGVDLAPRGRFGQATAVTIQGSESHHVLVMVDGIPFNTQLSGQANPARIPIEHIERIEVVKGASSSAWGSSLGGVINVITKSVGTEEGIHGRVTNSFAEFKTTKHSLELHGKAKDVGFYAMASHLNTDGIRTAADTKETFTYTKIGTALTDNVRIDGAFGYSGGDVRDGTLPTNRNNFAPFNSRYGNTTVSYDDHNGTYFNIAGKFNDQDVKSESYNATTGARTSSSISHSLYKNVSFSGGKQFREDDLLVFGADFDWHSLKSATFLDEGISTSVQAPYMNYRFSWNDFDIIPGARYDHSEHFGSQFSPSIGMIYHIPGLKDTRARAKIARDFSAPALFWLFNFDPAQSTGPNPDLVAERSWVYEVGFETGAIDKTNVELNLYWAETKDAIGFTTDPNSSLIIRDNFRKFRRQGVEMLVDYQPIPELKLYTSGAFNHVTNRQTRKIVRNNGTARQSFRVGANYKNKHGFGVNIYGFYDRWDSSPSRQPNDQKFLFDIKLTQDLEDFYKDYDAQIFLNIYNVSNSAYWENINFPLPLRYYEGGFSVDF